MKELCVAACALGLASCAHASGFSPLPNGAAAMQALRARDDAVTFAHLFSFDGRDGKEPAAAFIDAGTTLYGTTYAGGARDEGTVYAITTSGTQRVLHSFRGGSDGALPLASVISADGALYGTTAAGGGPGGEGVVYEIDSSGTESIVHRFGAAGDGANPYAGLVELNKTFYGTTAGGGTTSNGTVFTIALSGMEAVLYSFGATRGDGNTPAAGLIAVGGVLYGTTQFGGGHCGSVGCGAVFKITPSGSETPLYGFKGGSDGSQPAAPLVEIKGALYGTTTRGGASNLGTVFKITTSGTESVIYAFKGADDGATPQSLIAVNGGLYGTTSAGGSHNLGTVFSVTTRGRERVLYAFRGGKNGATPRAGLADAGGDLYGTTAGGANKTGTVFRITL